MEVSSKTKLPQFQIISYNSQSRKRSLEWGCLKWNTQSYFKKWQNHNKKPPTNSYLLVVLPPFIGLLVFHFTRENRPILGTGALQVFSAYDSFT